MTWWFHIFVYLAAATCQTALIPAFSESKYWYDLLLPYIFWLGMARPFREGLSVVFCFGFLMDGLSNAPLGFYCTAYFWVFNVVYWGTSFLNITNRLILTGALVGSVLFQNIVFAGSLILFSENYLPSFPAIAAIFFWNLLLAAVTAPALFHLYKVGYEQWIRLLTRIQQAKES